MVIAALVDGCQTFNIALWLLAVQPRAEMNKVPSKVKFKSIILGSFVFLNIANRVKVRTCKETWSSILVRHIPIQAISLQDASVQTSGAAV